MKTKLLFSLVLALLITVSSTFAQTNTCGTVFTDPAGAGVNYANDSDYTITFCPDNPGEVVTVTFASFNTEANWDALYVFDGNSTASPMISSTNPAGNVPGGVAGGYWGDSIPDSFTSTSPDGCLTFRFRSDPNVNNLGWVANVSCGPPTTCPKPNTLTAVNIGANSASIAWNSSDITQWEYTVLPAGSPTPNATTLGTMTSINPTLITGLTQNTCYTFYIRALCSATDTSDWSAGYDFCTAFGPPACGGLYVDNGGISGNYANNSDQINTICPNTTGNIVTVTFTSFYTEANWDALYVFDGNSTASPMIPSTNQGANVPGGLAGGYWGTALPGPFTSTSADGCLTFRFRADSAANKPGWIANVDCSPEPTCLKPTALTASYIGSSTATIGWNSGTATQWEYTAVPAGSPAPTATTTGTTTTLNPTIITGLNQFTCYTFYVRAHCSANDTSYWSTGYNFCTTANPPVCGGSFVDNGGPSANYPNNSDNIYTVCPDTTGDAVTVTFSAFYTESMWDGLYVYDGNSISATQIPSANPSGFGLLNLPGAYYGNSIPGPFTSESPNGCLTFRFVSNASLNEPGWVADVSCNPAPTCLRPSNVTSINATQSSITLSWSDVTPASSWEIIALPLGSTAPTSSVSGQPVTSNPGTISGLESGTTYSFYVRTNCSSGNYSNWSNAYNTNTLSANDECANAIEITPTLGHICTQPTAGSLIGATASTLDLTPCNGPVSEDVWFKFVANNDDLNVSILNLSIPGIYLHFAIYTGSCGTLTPFACTDSNLMSKTLTNLTIGTTYYVRIYSTGTSAQSPTFNLCITIPSNCSNSESICGVNNYTNTSGVASLGTIGCLISSPNPTFFTVKIAESGPVNLLITQKTIDATYANLDVDYAAWGPFTDQTAACNFVGNAFPFQDPSLDGNATTQLTGCSFSAAPIENLHISNAQAGQYYILLITNYSNQPGIINVSQSNVNTVGAGSIDCAGIRLNAFMDYNANGVQDNGEPNSPIGQFHYTVNNDGNEHLITSSTGSYIIYNQNLSDLYNLSYTVNSDYSALYTVPSSFANVSVATGSMTTYNFPLVSLQAYNDLGVTIVPINAPRAGTNYKVKIIYTNFGSQTIAAGTLTFTNNPGTSITGISQTGTTATPTGFTYAFTALAPYESRSMIVTLAVPAMPAVYLGQLLSNSVSITPPTGDVVASNNANNATQAVAGSYDPNDKVESHGEQILFSSFTQNDYLEYTIRFENNGTAGALNITVNDLLDSKLDETSIVMLAASHTYSLDRLGNNLTWKFNNIQLPVSIPNTDIGKGFVKFKIKPKPGYAVGDIIPNTAQIYFDTNPAIVTNTFNTTFVTTLGNDLFTESSIRLFPNPTTNLVQVTITNSPETIDTITIYDVLGKNVMSISAIASNQKTIDASTLAKGIYLVEITTEHHLKQIKKLIVQ